MRQTTIYDFIEGGNPSFSFVQSLHQELARLGNKVSPSFIDSIVDASTISYHKLTPTMRVCVITTPTGHEVIGVARTLDKDNDVASIGNAVALSRAKDELWYTVGAVAKVLL